MLEDIKESFAVIASSMDTFMDAPVLNAIAVGEMILTPNTPLNEDGTMSIKEWKNIWDEHQDDEEIDPVLIDDEVKIEVRYKEQLDANCYGSECEDLEKASSVGFIAIIACILVIICLVLFAVCLYKKIVASEQVEKSIPENVQARDEF